MKKKISHANLLSLGDYNEMFVCKLNKISGNIDGKDSISKATNKSHAEKADAVGSLSEKLPGYKLVKLRERDVQIRYDPYKKKNARPAKCFISRLGRNLMKKHSI